MTALLRGEWIKFRSVRSPWVLCGLAVALALFITGIATGSSDTRNPAEQVGVSSTFVNVLLIVFGVQLIAQEYRFGTIRATFTAVPDRVRLLSAKTMFGFGVGLATSLIAIGGSLLVAAVVLNGDGRSLPFDSRLTETIAGFVLTAAISVVLGMGVGAITRNPALAITLVLVEMFVIEQLVFAFVSEDIGRVLPFAVAFASIPEGGDNLVSPWYLALVLYAAWAAGLLAIGAAIVNRRDP